MSAAKKGNWTKEEQTAALDAYGKGESVEAIAERLNRTNRSVIGKLTAAGVYRAPEKPEKQPREQGPTKSDILSEIGGFGVETDGGATATKPFLVSVLSVMKRLQAAE